MKTRDRENPVARGVCARRVPMRARRAAQHCRSTRRRARPGATCSASTSMPPATTDRPAHRRDRRRQAPRPRCGIAARATAARAGRRPFASATGMPVPHHPHRSNDPQVASNGRQVVAVWASAGRGFRGSGPMVTALSSDGGKTWKRGPNPADDDRHDGHGFADIAARDGRFHLTWLDSRSGAQGVRYARSADGGATWSANMSVNRRAANAAGIRCSPRPTAACICSFAARARATWASRRRATTADVENARAGRRVQLADRRVSAHRRRARADRQGASRTPACAWYGPAKPGERGVHYLSSSDGGATGAHARGSAASYAQRADLAARGRRARGGVGRNGRPDRRGVHLALEQRRRRWTKPMRLSSESASATYPRIVATGSDFIVLWTEATGGESKLRIVLMKCSLGKLCKT